MQKTKKKSPFIVESSGLPGIGKITIFHVITGLGMGGAEMMLYKLLSCMDQKTFTNEVVSLTEVSVIGRKIQEMGVRVRALRVNGLLSSPLAVIRLAWWMRKARPAIVQTWMYHGNLFGGLAARLAGSVPVIWGIRQSNLDLKSSRRSTIFISKLGARLSPYLPNRIVNCSSVAKDLHVSLGYASRKMTVIPNGFDPAEFRPNQSARTDVRRSLGIPENGVVVGLVGRFHPQKDHKGFIDAAGELSSKLPDVYFLLCGKDINSKNQQLMTWIKEARLDDRCLLLGIRQDMPRLVAAFDIAVSSSSFGEGFSNVIGEAMACGVPCVATDIGDSSFIVGDTGRIVPPKNSQAMAKALEKLIGMDPDKRTMLGNKARSRIEKHFSLSAVTARYENLYLELIHS